MSTTTHHEEPRSVSETAESAGPEDYNPELLDTMLQEGKAQFTSEDFEGAAETFKLMISLNRRHKAAWNNLGVTMHVQEKWSAALEAFSQALAIDVHDRDIRHNVRTLLMDTDQDGLMDAEVLVKYGEALHREGRVEEAYEQFVLAVQSDETHAEAWNDLGVTMLQLGQTSEAEQVLRRALELDASDSNTKTNLATLLVSVDRREEALELFLDILSVDETDQLASERIVEFGLLTEPEIAAHVEQLKAQRAIQVLLDTEPRLMDSLGFELRRK